MYTHPIEQCVSKHGSNSTLEFHECMCDFNYSYFKSRVKALKMKHCIEAAKIDRLNNFYAYMFIGGILIVLLVVFIAVFCSCKWYMETNEVPCQCCSLFCFCKKKKKKPSEQRVEDDSFPEVYEQTANGHSWTPVTLPPSRETIDTSSPPASRKGLCMNFCLSDPVQDCCEFFDCDFLWRKRSLYNIPIFGRKKVLASNFQRQPSRPAPPPPKAVVLPQVKYPQPIVDECEPVPEAPPSPEPVRVLNPRSLYVDPLAFLQKPFMKSHAEKQEEKAEPIYTKFKNIVLSKMKKSGSSASINDVSVNANGISMLPNGIVTYGGRNHMTGSLASLHNLDANDGSSCSSKRSMSLASLPFTDESCLPNDPRSRISVVSTMTEDIPPSARKDEYIDLEEMSKTLQAKRRIQQQQQAIASIAENQVPAISRTYTPNFIPASAFPNTQSGNMPICHPPETAYFPPVPASDGRPAVPARTMVSPTNTLSRSKPIVPPRPPASYDGDQSLSRNVSYSQQSLSRSPRLVKPNVPPPPPPNPHKPPMESCL